MADPWTHALNLDRAVRQGGVAQARVAQEDYEGAKPLIRKVWTGKLWANPLERIRSRGEEVIPAYALLGYLRGYFLYREVPENDQAFWPSFLGDLGIERRHSPTEAEYNRLWRVLEWHPETSGHLRYHQGGVRDFVGTLDAVFHFRALRLKTLKVHFLRFYLDGELSEEARPYERIFRRLQEAMGLLLEAEEVPDLLHKEAVLSFLQEAGLHLGEPNPIRLLFHRSDQALGDFYRALKGKPPPTKRGTGFRHKQVRVEFLSFPAHLKGIWPTLSREPLLEGWKVYGRVVLEDERFKGFQWVPRLTPEGDPIPEELQVSFEEGEVVRFLLHHRAFAVRFSKPVWRVDEPLELRPVGFDPAQHPLRFLLASGGEAKTDPAALAREVRGSAGLRDELIVEVRTDGQSDEWRWIARLPVEGRAHLEAWVAPQGVLVRARPPGLAVQVRAFAGERLVQEGELVPEDQDTLVLGRGLVPLRVEVRLGDEVRSLTLPPKGWPTDWWRTGLGLGRSILADQGAETGPGGEPPSG